LDNPKLLARYYDVLAWERVWFEFFNLENIIKSTHDHLREAPAEEYWWDALNFIILAHATGRDDLLKDAKPEKLRARFETWYTWFEENRLYLRSVENGWLWTLDENAKARSERPPIAFPDWDALPDDPFDDWKELAAPPRTMFHLIR
jgi:hypothetical protein